MADKLMDPDDLRPVYLRIADELRAAYSPGVQIDSVPKIAESWGVAKETVRSAIDVLRNEGLIVSWQGRGTFYRVRVDDGTAEEPAEPATVAQFEKIMTRLDRIEDRLNALEQTRKH